MEIDDARQPGRSTVDVDLQSFHHSFYLREVEKQEQSSSLILAFVFTSSTAASASASAFLQKTPIL